MPKTPRKPAAASGASCISRGVRTVQVTRDDGLIGTSAAAALARVKPGTIYVWVSRGHLAKAGLDEHGRSLYRPEDVIRAERKLRPAARRIILPRAA